MLRSIEKVNIKTGLLAVAHNLRKKVAGKALFKVTNSELHTTTDFLNPKYILHHTVP